MGGITITTHQGSIGAHLAVPAGHHAVFGVVVIHAAFGLNDDIRGHADALAGAGYLALAPDLYARGGALRCLATTMAALARGRGRAFDDIEATRKWLLEHDRCSGRVGIIGFCMGGGFAIACAPHREFSAAAPNYGMVPRNAERALAGACPIVGSYGAKDWMMPGQARRLEGALEALGIPHDVKEYPGATHSFLNRHSGVVPTALDRIARIRFSAPAAEDAWARIFAFFAQHLGPEGR
jgi:carboxymethylenebutenolidase